jgi:hypothetical protein
VLAMELLMLEALLLYRAGKGIEVVQFCWRPGKARRLVAGSLFPVEKVMRGKAEKFTFRHRLRHNRSRSKCKLETEGWLLVMFLY